MSGRGRIPPPATRGTDAVSGSVLAHQPELLAAFQRLYAILWRGGRLPHRLKEMARLRNARIVGCTYCQSVRFSTARAEGLTEAVVDRIADGYADDDALTDREKLVLRYTDVFLRDPGGLDDALRAQLLAAFTPAEIVELTAALALFMGFSKIAVSLGTLPASLPVTEVPTPDWPARD